MDNSRRFRGLVGTALTWGVALATLATGTLAVGLATGLVPASVFGARELVAVAVRGLIVGGVGGAFFAWLLARRERGQSVATLSAPRVAVWGFVAAGSLPVLMALAADGATLPFGVLIAATAGFGGMSSLLGTASLRIARRANPRLDAADDERARLTP